MSEQTRGSRRRLSCRELAARSDIGYERRRSGAPNAKEEAMKYMLLIYKNPTRGDVLRRARSSMGQRRRDHRTSSPSRASWSAARRWPIPRRPRRSASRRRPGGHRRPVRRGQGVLGQLPDRRRATASSAPSRSPRAGPTPARRVEVRPLMDEAGDGDVSVDAALEDLLRGWRRRSSARSSAATAIRRLRGRRPGGAAGRRRPVAGAGRARRTRAAG